MKEYEYYMNLAILEAKKAKAADEVPVGAVMVCDNLVLAKGSNAPISLSDPTAHAEIVCLRNCCHTLGNYRLPPNTYMFVTLEPCIMCLGALIHARLGHLIIGARSDSRLIEVKHNIKITYGVAEKECSMLLKNYFRNKR